MTEHAIKIKEVYFKAVLSGEKTFEIRKNDRNYQVGDIIHFVPVDDECGMIIPHDPNAYRITYIFHGGEYGLEEGYCVFGIRPEAYDRKNGIGRLIDADALIEEAKEMHVDDFMLVFGMVNKQPTAYDVEKVVAELENKKGTYFDGLKCEGTMMKINEAIDIVKRGGVE